MPGYIDPKFRDGEPEPSFWNQVKGVLALVAIALATGVAVLLYVGNMILNPSLNL